MSPRGIIVATAAVTLAVGGYAPVVRAAPSIDPVDPSPYRLEPAGSQRAAYRIVDQLLRRLPHASMAGIIARADRRARPLDGSPALAGVTGVFGGFRWDRRDDLSPEWYPQGITGSFDAAPARRRGTPSALIASWYSKGTGGARVSFVRMGRGPVRYRHVLLVEPVRRAGRADFQAVRVHAGGIAWLGPYLYVADTQHGLRAFDLRRMFRVSGRSRRRVGRDERGRYHAAGYRYALPQVQSYVQPTAAARFSFVSLDRSTDPPSLVTGEYRAGRPGGRLLRWRLSPRSGRIVPGPAWEAYSSSVTNMQGALSAGGQFTVASSRGERAGRLWWGAPDAELASAPWAVGPEDLAFSPGTGRIYSLTEHPGRRVVFSVGRR